MNLKQILTLLFVVMSFLGASTSNVALAKDETSDKAHEVVSSNAAIVDLNTAGIDELMSLKGIGKKRAEAILADRTQNGRFNSIEDLKRIKGFTEKVVTRIIMQNEGRIIVSK